MGASMTAIVGTLAAAARLAAAVARCTGLSITSSGAVPELHSVELEREPTLWRQLMGAVVA